MVTTLRRFRFRRKKRYESLYPVNRATSVASINSLSPCPVIVNVLIAYSLPPARYPDLVTFASPAESSSTGPPSSPSGANCGIETGVTTIGGCGGGGSAVTLRGVLGSVKFIGGRACLAGRPRLRFTGNSTSGVFS